jgi:HEAT repeat protein
LVDLHDKGIYHNNFDAKKIFLVNSTLKLGGFEKVQIIESPSLAVESRIVDIKLFGLFFAAIFPESQTPMACNGSVRLLISYCQTPHIFHRQENYGMTFVKVLVESFSDFPKTPSSKFQPSPNLRSKQASSQAQVDNLVSLIAAGSDWSSTIKAVEYLSQINLNLFPEAIHKLLECLSNENVHNYASKILMQQDLSENTSVLSRLGKLLQNFDKTVRENAAQILATQDLSKHKEVILVLLSALKDENRWVRYFSIEALGRQDSSSFPNIIDGLLDAFQEPDVDVGIQRKVVEVLGYQDLQDHKLALETLIKAMDSKDKGIIKNAVVSFGKQNIKGKATGILALMRLLNHGDKAIRIQAALSLCQVSTIHEILQTLPQFDWESFFIK